MPYTVRQLARLSGVSVRTLHHYDSLGLLHPRGRSEAGYRLYGEQELLRLQQILCYRTLGMSLREIGELLQAPGFDTLNALFRHRAALEGRQRDLQQLLRTVDRTIAKLRGDIEMSDEELYAGFPAEARGNRQEAMQKWGEETVRRSEQALKAMGREQREQLQQDFTSLWETLAAHAHLPPDSAQAQALVERHYQMTRQFWGTAPSAQPTEAYRGLGQLFLDDERFTSKEGVPRPQFARFLCEAIRHYCDTAP